MLADVVALAGHGGGADVGVVLARDEGEEARARGLAHLGGVVRVRVRGRGRGRGRGRVRVRVRVRIRVRVRVRATVRVGLPTLEEWHSEGRYSSQRLSKLAGARHSPPSQWCSSGT